MLKTKKSDRTALLLADLLPEFGKGLFFSNKMISIGLFTPELRTKISENL